MYFEDLSPYTYASPKDLPEGVETGGLATAFNVGWLENGYPFDVGATPWRFRWRLRRMAKDPKNPMFGFHECCLCEGAKRRPSGNGEIHVVGSDGITYVAPELVVHYVSKHRYLPPQKFIDAVMTSGH